MPSIFRVRTRTLLENLFLTIFTPLPLHSTFTLSDDPSFYHAVILGHWIRRITTVFLINVLSLFQCCE